MRLARLTLDVLVPDELDAVPLHEVKVKSALIFATDDIDNAQIVEPFQTEVIATHVVVTD